MLTLEQETALKKIADEQIKQDALDAIQAKYNDLVKPIEAQMNALIEAKNAEIEAVK